MMNEFKIVYWPGGMTLNRSGWWLCRVTGSATAPVFEKIRMLKKA